MNMMVLNLVAIGVGGSLGGMARYWVSGAMACRFGDRFPWGTLIVNITGAGAIGIIAALALDVGLAGSASSALWAGLVIGAVGSYTTVSAFSLQTLGLLRAGEFGRAAANVAGSLVFCLSSAAAGYFSVFLLMPS